MGPLPFPDIDFRRQFIVRCRRNRSTEPAKQAIAAGIRRHDGTLPVNGVDLSDNASGNDITKIRVHYKDSGGFGTNALTRRINLYCPDSGGPDDIDITQSMLCRTTRLRGHRKCPTGERELGLGIPETYVSR